jgi:hypothetical protein
MFEFTTFIHIYRIVPWVWIQLKTLWFHITKNSLLLPNFSNKNFSSSRLVPYMRRYIGTIFIYYTMFFHLRGRNKCDSYHIVSLHIHDPVETTRILLGMCYIIFTCSSFCVAPGTRVGLRGGVQRPQEKKKSSGNVSHFFLIFHVSPIFVSIVGRLFGT